MTADKTARDERLDELASRVQNAAFEYYGSFSGPSRARLEAHLFFTRALAALLAAAKDVQK